MVERVQLHFITFLQVVAEFALLPVFISR